MPLTKLCSHVQSMRFRAHTSKKTHFTRSVTSTGFALFAPQLDHIQQIRFHDFNQYILYKVKFRKKLQGVISSFQQYLFGKDIVNLFYKI